LRRSHPRTGADPVSDIVERLRSKPPVHEDCVEAANEIERLRHAMDMIEQTLWKMGFDKTSMAVRKLKEGQTNASDRRGIQAASGSMEAEQPFSRAEDHRHEG
jgi:hypothetical protein